MNETIEDPVCHMKVPPTSHIAEYAGSHYAFCSAQCRERFLANPRLYVGFPGRKAPAQKGEKVIKRHRLTLTAPLDAMQAERIRQALLEMMGINEVCIEENKIEIEYDLIQVTLEQITDKLTSAGAGLDDGWIERFKSALINNLEEVEISGMEVNNKKCCH